MRLSKFPILNIIKSFLPFQLLVSHIKYNMLALLYWLVLFAIVTGNLGSAYGVNLLFFSPEYLGEVSSLAFLLIGFSVGGFIMGFNTYSYIKLGPQFPFLVVVTKPFLRFCLNNFIIPVLFIVLYCYNIAAFQLEQEHASTQQIILYIGGFLMGIGIFFLFSFFYFFPINKNLFSLVKNTNQEHFFANKPISSPTHNKEKWYDLFQKQEEKVYYYIGKQLKIHTSRTVLHLDQEIIEKVFAKNRINTSVFELITIISFFILGGFRDYDIFNMPASMSFILLLTIILMLFSAMLSWFHRWTYAIIILLFVGMDHLSVTTPFFNYTNYAYGLDYGLSHRQNYSIDNIEEATKTEFSDEKSYSNYIHILEKWKEKTGEDKPKLIIVNTSGGGSRSALWTFTVLQKANERLQGRLFNYTHLITGASGGMVGASYYREILLRSRKGDITDLNSPRYRKNIAKDLLNKLFFTASTNDLFFRYQKTKINGITYPKDRGYSFEKQLLENTENYIDHNLGYYSKYEANATIPVMIFSPTIINDGRRLLISSQPLSFLTRQNSDIASSHEHVDYLSFFKNNKPLDIRFSSVVRIQATFPFVLPMVTMPTKPDMQLMDAGIRDNYGVKTMAEFLNATQKWIEENTSGIIILQIRDTKRLLKDEVYEQFALSDKLSIPFSNMYRNFTKTQDFDQEQLLESIDHNLNVPIYQISFNLRENRKDRISLSWHLTRDEKQKIEKAFMSIQNQLSLKKLSELIFN